MLNLKMVLMQLGNKLVMEHGYDPATVMPVKIYNTVAIHNFTEFMNNSPEARVVLREMGLEWPIMKKFLAIIVLLFATSGANAQGQNDPVQQAYWMGYNQGYNQAYIQGYNQQNYNQGYNQQQWMAYQRWLQQNQTMLAVLEWHRKAQRHQIQTPIVLPNQRRR